MKLKNLFLLIFSFLFIFTIAACSLSFNNIKYYNLGENKSERQILTDFKVLAKYKGKKIEWNSLDSSLRINPTEIFGNDYLTVEVKRKKDDVVTTLIATIKNKNEVFKKHFLFTVVGTNDPKDDIITPNPTPGPSTDVKRPDGSNYPTHFGPFPTIPANYYDNINFDNDSAETIINKISEWENKYTRLSYDHAGKYNKMTEADISEENPDKTYGIYNSQLYQNKWESGKTFNREHVWCNSKLGVGKAAGAGNSTQATDIHNLRVCETRLNSTRNNHDFGSDGNDEVELGHLHHASGHTQFFPGKEHKGDVARILLYMACKWRKQNLKLVEYRDPSTGNYSPSHAFIGDIRVLKKWNREDPVSNFEVHRNEVIYKYQKDRNVFIDHPEWFDKIIDFLVAEQNTQSIGYSYSKKIINNAINQFNNLKINLNELRKESY